jgi:hypothetical protein
MKISGNYCCCNHVVALIQDWKKSIKGLNVLLSVLPFQGVEEMVNWVLGVPLHEEYNCDFQKVLFFDKPCTEGLQDVIVLVLAWAIVKRGDEVSPRSNALIH